MRTKSVGSTVSWTAYSIFLKKWQSPLGASARLAVIALAGVLVMVPFTIWEAAVNPLPLLTWPGFGLALAAAVFPGFGAYLAFSVIQRELGAARASVVLYLGPIYSAGVAWLVLAEPVRHFHYLGLALILPGIYLVNKK